MLRFATGTSRRMCDAVSRRSFLQIGTLGLAGLNLSHLLSLRAEAAPGQAGHYLKDKSIVLLFLGGGPSQLETWDPKPHGIDSSTSLAGHIPTALPGVRFASYFPKMAGWADRLSVVRSFQTNHAEHSGAHKQLMTADLTVTDGGPIHEPGIGAVISRVAGAAHPTTGMPTHAMIPPTTKHIPKAGGFAGAYESIVAGAQPAWLSAAYSPLETQVEMSEGSAKRRKKDDDAPVSPLISNLQPRLPADQVRSRLSLLEQLDRLDRRIDATGAMNGMDQYTQQAVNLLRGDRVRQALDLSQEDPRLVARYDTEHFRNWQCDEQSRFKRKTPSIGISLGRQLLLARRLCEAGSRFVTVIHPNWDFHARPGIPNMPEGMGVLAPPLDHAVDAFLTDIHQSGLDQEILLVITGEFGRTPKLDENLGRHHWPRICPLVFAGGGLQHGQVIGQSDRRGGEPAGDAYVIDDLHATLMHAMFDVGQLRLDTSLPAKIHERAMKGRRIEPLFG